MTELTNSSIDITVQTEFLHEQSDANRFIYAYTVQITNHYAQPMQLISRHWVITDGNEQVQELRGEGVVGEQPLIGQGESYTYTSGVALDTPFGTSQRRGLLIRLGI